MGRAKLEMKYREEAKVRINTYKTRIKGMEKKAKELSVLCGIDVLFASFSPDLKAFHYWPNNPSEFHRIVGRYKSISSSNPPLNSSLIQEELFAMNKKLEEVRQRIYFLEAEKMAASSSSAAAVVVNHDDEENDIYSMLEDLGEDLLPSISCENSIFKDNWNICSDQNYFESTVMGADFDINLQ